MRTSYNITKLCLNLNNEIHQFSGITAENPRFYEKIFCLCMISPFYAYFYRFIAVFRHIRQFFVDHYRKVLSYFFEISAPGGKTA